MKINLLTSQQLAEALKRTAQKEGNSAEKLAREYGIPSPTIHGWIRHRQQSRKNMEQIARVLHLCLDNLDVFAPLINEPVDNPAAGPLQLVTELAQKIQGEADGERKAVRPRKRRTRRLP